MTDRDTPSQPEDPRDRDETGENDVDEPETDGLDLGTDWLIDQLDTDTTGSLPTVDDDAAPAAERDSEDTASAPQPTKPVVESPPMAETGRLRRGRTTEPPEASVPVSASNGDTSRYPSEPMTDDTERVETGRDETERDAAGESRADDASGSEVYAPPARARQTFIAPDVPPTIDDVPGVVPAATPAASEDDDDEVHVPEAGWAQRGARRDIDFTPDETAEPRPWWVRDAAADEATTDVDADVGQATVAMPVVEEAPHGAGAGEVVEPVLEDEPADESKRDEPPTVAGAIPIVSIPRETQPFTPEREAQAEAPSEPEPEVELVVVAEPVEPELAQPEPVEPELAQPEPARATRPERAAERPPLNETEPFVWSLAPNDELDPLVHSPESEAPVIEAEIRPAAQEAVAPEPISPESARREPAPARSPEDPVTPVESDDEVDGPQTRLLDVVPEDVVPDEAAVYTPSPTRGTDAAPRARALDTDAEAVTRKPSSTRGGGRSIPPAVVWVAAVVVAVLILVGLFFLGTRIPLLFAASATASSPVTPTFDANTTPADSEAAVEVPATGPLPAGDHAWNTLRGGECVDPYAGPWAESFTVVDCGVSHSAQLTSTLQVSDDPAAAYPGEGSIADRVVFWCSEPSRLDRTAAAAYADLQVEAAYPVNETQWGEGERSVYCFVSRTTGDPLTGSIAVASPA